MSAYLVTGRAVADFGDEIPHDWSGYPCVSCRGVVMLPPSSAAKLAQALRTPGYAYPVGAICLECLRARLDAKDVDDDEYELEVPD
jgi:hypothetical protein